MSTDTTQGNVRNRYYVELGSGCWRIVDRRGKYRKEETYSFRLIETLAVFYDAQKANEVCAWLNEREKADG